MHNSRWRLLRIVAAHPRLFASSALGSVVAAALWLLRFEWNISPLLIGWNTGAFLYIVFVFRLMMSCEQSSIRRRARIQSEGAVAVFAFSILSGIAGLSSTMTGLTTVRNIHGLPRTVHIALTALTITTSWLFTHLMFAQEYAHRY